MSFDFRTNASPTINLNLDDEEAVPKCENGPGCTHFTWTLFNGGTCWMKKGRMSRNGTETITIKADDPNSFCAKLAKFAKSKATQKLCSINILGLLKVVRKVRIGIFIYFRNYFLPN